MSNGAHVFRGLVLQGCGCVGTPVALVIGWVGWDFRTGVLAALGTFGVGALLSAISFLRVTDPSWFVVVTPFLLGCAYSLLPDFIPIPIDDLAAVGCGGIVSTILALKRSGSLPVAAVLSMSVAALYTLVGDVLPGPVDEFFVYAITGGISVASIAGQERRRMT